MHGFVSVDHGKIFRIFCGVVIVKTIQFPNSGGIIEAKRS